MQFRLSNHEKITLSDCGGTYQYMAKYFERFGDSIRQRVEWVMNDYGLELKTEGEKSELYIQIHDEQGAFRSFLWLFSAIERITNTPTAEYEQRLRDLLSSKEE